MKRIAGLLAALLFAFTIVACGNGDGDATAAPAGSPAASEVASE